MVALGVMRYRVMVGQQLQFAAEPGKLIDGLRSLGRARRECGTLPLPLFWPFSFFSLVLSEGTSSFPVWRGLRTLTKGVQ